MFGYAAPDLKALSKPAREAYYACYCGLCRALAKRYGFAARLLLNYDTALLLALDGGEKSFCRCPYKLGKKYECIAGENADYAADATVILSYLKFADDADDDRSPRARALMRIYRGAYQKACAARPELADRVKDKLAKLSRIERDGETDPDVPAQTFAELLEGVFLQNKSFARALGAAIYVTDAACDHRRDLKKGRYNPLAAFGFKRIDGIVNAYFAGCERELESAGFTGAADEIARSVVYRGLRKKYDIIKKMRGGSI